MNDQPSFLFPNLILGVRLGVEKNDATTAMALATRRLRKMSPPGLTMADLTSALARLDGTSGSATDLLYQWPADPRTIPVKFNMNFRGRAHTSPQSLLDDFMRDPETVLSAQDGNSLGIAYLSEAFDAVNSWEWQKGIDLAKEAYSKSSNERIQDEALNIIAAANLMMGKRGLAIAALKKAIDGEWNVGLHQNLALLTMTDDPRAAIENLSFIIATSRNADQRVKAVQVALSAWSAANNGLDQDDQEIPPSLRDALRELVVGRIDIDQFRTIARYLANNDDAWVSVNKFGGSLHAGTLEAKLYTARAGDIAEYCELLGENSGPGSPGWVVDEAEEVAGQLVNLLLSSEMQRHIPLLAMRMIDGGLNNSTIRRIELKGAVALRLDEVIDEDSEPLEKFMVWIESARRALSSVVPVEGDRDRVLRLLSAGAETYTRLLLRHRASVYDDFVDVVNTLGSSRDRNAAAAVVNWCVDTLRLLPFCRAQIETTDLCSMMDGFINEVSEMREFASRYL